jgi:hypothetical protein
MMKKAILIKKCLSKSFPEWRFEGPIPYDNYSIIYMTKNSIRRRIDIKKTTKFNDLKKSITSYIENNIENDQVKCLICMKNSNIGSTMHLVGCKICGKQWCEECEFKSIFTSNKIKCMFCNNIVQNNINKNEVLNDYIKFHMKIGSTDNDVMNEYIKFHIGIQNDIGDSLDSKIRHAIIFIKKYNVLRPDVMSRIEYLESCIRKSKYSEPYQSTSGKSLKIGDFTDLCEIVEFILVGFSRDEQNLIFEDLNLLKGHIIEENFNIHDVENMYLEQLLTLMSHTTRKEYIHLNYTDKIFPKMFD